MLMMWLYTYQCQTIHHNNHFSRIPRIDLCKITISEVLGQKPKYDKYYATLNMVVDSMGHAHQVSGKILVYAYGDSDRLVYSRGNQLLVKGKILNIKPPVNEGDFDYQFNLSIKDIHQSISISKSSAILISNDSYQILQTADKIRNACNTKIKTFIQKKDNYGVAEALLLGYKYDIDANINQVFARTGTLHVLAVSGMHVGLIYGILLWMCSFIGNAVYSKYLRFLLLLSGIWGYALLSGLGASILRASVMFSFISLAQLSGRKTKSFNLLAASAFFLFLNDPLCLFDPGFQLSYSAVAGIIFIYPLLRPFCQFRYSIATYIAELLALTLTAQTFTLPFSLYYFGQFPNGFLLANLVIIPLTTILIFGLIALVTIPFNAFNEVLGNCIDYGLSLNYQIAKTISDLPWAVSEGLYIDTFELLFILFITSLICKFLYNKNNKVLIMAMSLFCLLLLKLDLKQWTNSNQCELSFYKVSNQQIPICLNGNNAIIVSDTFNLDANTFSSQSIKKYFSIHGIKKYKIVSTKKLFVSTNFLMIPEVGFQFFDKTVTIDKIEQKNRHQRNAYKK